MQQPAKVAASASAAKRIAQAFVRVIKPTDTIN
jgi:hypothetical protein